MGAVVIVIVPLSSFLVRCGCRSRRGRGCLGTVTRRRRGQRTATSRARGDDCSTRSRATSATRQTGTSGPGGTSADRPTQIKLNLGLAA